MQKKYFDLSYKHYEENVIIEDIIFINPKNNSAYNFPKIENTTIYISNINSSFDEKMFRILFGLISIIFNQYPKPCISKCSNSNLKVQKKDLVGIKINLNKKNTYNTNQFHF
jgi:ribosomal protein L5